MKIRRLFVLAAAIGIATQATPAVAQQPARAIFDELKQGGFVIVIRHGRTNESPAFPRDEAPTNLADCSGQTMLTEAGRDQARAIGAAFRNADIPVGKVLASGLCRAVETGRLAFGRVEASDALLIESHSLERHFQSALTLNGNSALDEHKKRLENASNTWLLTTVTKLNQQSDKLISEMSDTTEKKLKVVCENVFSQMGEILHQRLAGLASPFSSVSHHHWL